MQVVEDVEVAIKVVIVGNGSVGKSSMIQRYCKGVFSRDYKKTIGVDFLEKQVHINGEDMRLMLWDTAGQEEFDAITKAYYRGAQACVLVFSTVDNDSFAAVPRWKEKVEREVGEVPTVLVQNKIDLLNEATVTSDEAEALAKKMKARLYRTSVMEDLNVSAGLGIFAASPATQPGEAEGLRDDLVTLRPSKQRAKKRKVPFGSCTLL